MTGALSPVVAALVRVSAALAAWDRGDRRASALEAALRDARDAGADDVHVEEALLQSHLFVGYPAALNALRIWRDVQGGEGDRKGKGAAEEPGRPGSAPAAGASGLTREERRARGEEVCRRVYAGAYDGLRRNVRRLHPEMEAWMVEEGYGKVLGRPGLELPTRELCVAAILAVSGWPVQLYSHLRGALNTGASESEVDAALAVALDVAGEEEARVARETWRRVLGRRAEDGRGEEGR